ncbi:MAG: DUF4397 domain-containing protein [Thermomicrobiaceae bacterium]
MSRAIRLITALGLILSLSVAGVASASSHTGTVTIIHGVPGLTVDVYVNGELTLEGFEPESITDPLELEEGSYDIAIRAAGEPADSDPAISGMANVQAGVNASVIAHLTEDGTPSLAVFGNDVTTIGAGETRLTVRHAAAAPAVDAWIDGSVTVENLANGEEASLDVPAGTYNVAVSATGDDEPVLGPADFDLGEGTSYIVYAIGSLEDGSLNLLVQTISGLHDAPANVPAGMGSTATSEESGSMLLIMAAGFGVVAVAGSAFVIRRKLV